MMQLMMNQQRQATEIDSLLGKVQSSHDYKHSNSNDADYRRRRRSLLAGATTLAGTTLALSLLTSQFSFLRWNGPFDPEQQRSTLQIFTENAMSSIWPNITYRSNGHPRGKIQVIDGKKNHKNDEDHGLFRCTSQVMIMRHCDKEVKVNDHGHKRTTDMRDKHGDRHCNAKGKERSEYIATLFVDRDNYHNLLDENGYKIKDGIPPVPMVKSTLKKVHSFAAPKKPQFPVPLKLYALSPKRPADKPSKVHANYREIETITPLSTKFHLDVDERFGVEEEGMLASDFFQSLSESVTESLKRKSPTNNDNDKSSVENSGKSLCDGGLTVVNWKHSRIPTLARALGCGISDGCPRKYNSDDFDTLWLLTFQYTLLLREVNSDILNDMDPALDLESLSWSESIIPDNEQSSSSLRRHLNKNERRSNHVGSWKVSAKLVNEGFEPA